MKRETANKTLSCREFSQGNCKPNDQESPFFQAKTTWANEDIIFLERTREHGNFLCITAQMVKKMSSSMPGTTRIYNWRFRRNKNYWKHVLPFEEKARHRRAPLPRPNQLAAAGTPIPEKPHPHSHETVFQPELGTRPEFPCAERQGQPFLCTTVHSGYLVLKFSVKMLQFRRYRGLFIRKERNMKKIKDLAFGFSDAENYKRRENKELFNHLFLKNEYLEKIANPSISFLVGDKGTGKTAELW